MWCIIRGSFSKHICQELQGCWQEGESAAGYSRACPLTISTLTTTHCDLPAFLSQKLSIDTQAWIYLHYTENNLVEVSVKTEHRGA